MRLIKILSSIVFDNKQRTKNARPGRLKRQRAHFMTEKAVQSPLSSSEFSPPYLFKRPCLTRVYSAGVCFAFLCFAMALTMG